MVFEPSERSALNRYLPSCIALVLAVALGATILHVYTGNVSEAAAGIVRSLIWPFFAIMVVLFFRVQTENLFNTLISKIEYA